MLVLYADVLFAINFSMDFLALFFTSALLHIKLKKIRILLGSFFGAAYGIVQVFVDMNIIAKLIISLVVAIVMVTISFTEIHTKRILTASILYLFVSMMLGGIMTLIYTFLNSVLSEFLHNYTNEQTYNGARLFVIIALTAIASLIFSRILMSRKGVKVATVLICIGGKSFSLKGLCDSGNLLTEPFTGKCVILVTKNSGVGKSIDEISELHKKYIPYKDVTGTGMLKGIIPDRIYINDNLVSAVVAVSKNDGFNGYDALVPSALL